MSFVVCICCCSDNAIPTRLSEAAQSSRQAEQRAAKAREALRFFFSSEGQVFRGFLLDEVVRAADALSREALASLALQTGVRRSLVPAPLQALAPPLTQADEQVVASIQKLTQFFLGDLDTTGADAAAAANSNNPQLLRSLAPGGERYAQAQALLPVLRENQAEMRRFGLQIVGRLTELQIQRSLGWVRSALAP